MKKRVFATGIALLAFGFNVHAQIGKQEPSLSDSLNSRKESFNRKAGEAKKASYEAGIMAVANSGVLETAKKKGDVAPSFTLKNAVGKDIALKDCIGKGPVVLTWYRGGWCPYCNIALHYLQEYLPQFREEGATLLALTPELPDNSISTTEKHHLEFEVLSDIGNKVAKTYGIVYKLAPDVAVAYEKGFGLHEVNGDNSDELPLAATFIIDKKGIIRYAFVDADYRNRAEPDDILKALKELN